MLFEVDQRKSTIKKLKGFLISLVENVSNSYLQLKLRKRVKVKAYGQNSCCKNPYWLVNKLELKFTPTLGALINRALLSSSSAYNWKKKKRILREDSFCKWDSAICRCFESANLELLTS